MGSAQMVPKGKASAVCLIARRPRGGELEFLVVWNRRFKVWCFPGGKVDPGECLGDACRRELLEEAGVFGVVGGCVYSAPSAVEPDRTVHVFEVGIGPNDKPYEAEPGCPVTWMSRADLLAGPTFQPFYEQMFREVGGRWV